MFLWRRIVPAKWLDAWQERLRGFGPENLVVTQFPGGRTARLDLYSTTKSPCLQLVRHFGGKVQQTRTDAWIRKSAKPVVQSFAPHLVVSTSTTVPSRLKKTPLLVIPAGMAFGTGEHATTGMCLRHMLALLPASGSEPWRVLDLGTGSGILALAASLKGHRVEAMDFDPDSIRTCRENAALNPGISKVSWTRADVRKWEPKKPGYHLITANLFSQLHLETLPRMKKWLLPGGRLILSGIMKDQLPPVLEKMDTLGLVQDRVLRKGKWICILAHR